MSHSSDLSDLQKQEILLCNLLFTYFIKDRNLVNLTQSITLDAC
jgi:hypothetical protein